VENPTGAGHDATTARFALDFVLRDFSESLATIGVGEAEYAFAPERFPGALPPIVQT